MSNSEDKRHLSIVFIFRFNKKAKEEETKCVGKGAVLQMLAICGSRLSMLKPALFIDFKFIKSRNDNSYTASNAI